MKVIDDGWVMLLKFSENNGLIDYRFMLDTFKERIKLIDSYPK